VTISWPGGSGTVTLGLHQICKGQVDSSQYRTCQAFQVPAGAKITLTATAAAPAVFLFSNADSVCSYSKATTCVTVASPSTPGDNYAEAVFGDPPR
jgi:hypothetical protein